MHVMVCSSTRLCFEGTASASMRERFGMDMNEELEPCAVRDPGSVLQTTKACSNGVVE